MYSTAKVSKCDYSAKRVGIHCLMYVLGLPLGCLIPCIAPKSETEIKVLNSGPTGHTGGETLAFQGLSLHVGIQKSWLQNHQTD